jgi:isoleucyl-tRNA synthetase
MVPIAEPHLKDQLEAVRDLILSEVNVKEIEYIDHNSGVLVKTIKPNFKALGPRYGKMMKKLAARISAFSAEDIARLENEGSYSLALEGEEILINLDDVEIITQDIPGWVVSTMNSLTVALDITITDKLKDEGLARELVNRIQNLRRDEGFEVTDRITVEIEKNDILSSAIDNNFSYICSETLADKFTVVEEILEERHEVEITDDIHTGLKIKKLV